jgi:hypothetical protein
MPLDYQLHRSMRRMARGAVSHPASHGSCRDAHYPDVPALILSGELDNITTMADGAAVAGAFKHGTQIRVANSFHVNALPRARSGCGAEIVRRFIETLSPGDAACAAAVPPLRLVPGFAMRAAQVEPAKAFAGNHADAAQLRFLRSGDGRRRYWPGPAATQPARCGSPRRELSRRERWADQRVLD